MNHIEAIKLSCGYGPHEVLRQLSLEARAGEILTLVGPNGAGKTTLMRALAKILKPREGVVLIDKEDLRSLPSTQVAQRVSLAPQSERRDWPLTIDQAVRLGRVPHRGLFMPFTVKDQQVVDRVLRQTGLDGLRDRVITQLSGGEWRRMLLARALAQQAKVMLYDEPTAGLDLKYQLDMMELFRHLARDERLTLILTLHDLNLASLYSDRIAVIHNGAIEAAGTPGEVLTEDLLRRVYDIHSTVVKHPKYDKPMVIPMAAEDDG